MGEMWAALGQGEERDKVGIPSTHEGEPGEVI